MKNSINNFASKLNTTQLINKKGLTSIKGGSNEPPPFGTTENLNEPPPFG